MSIRNKRDELKDKIQYLLKQAGYIALSPIQAAVIPLVLQGRSLAVETRDSRGRTAAFLIPMLLTLSGEGKGIKGVIITDTSAQARHVEEELSRFSSKKLRTPSYLLLDSENNAKKDLQGLSKGPAIIVGTTERIIDHIRRDNLALENVVSVVLYPEKAEETGFEADINFILAKLPKKVPTQLFCGTIPVGLPLLEVLKRPTVIYYSDWKEAGEKEQINGPDKQNVKAQENDLMKTLRKLTKEQEEPIVKRIKEIVEAIKTEADPDLLQTYKKILRKQVPLTLRPYVGAYLLKQIVAPGVIKTENTAVKTLFISIGKTRKVFPKDLVKLFTSLVGISSKELGAIKILDNYSFVEITLPYAEKAIQLLDGTEFRGKRITVNYARKKDD